ncbi:lysosomal alpha-mannosidase isoform X2 [Microplitis demolitor]|uniref:lysosomal alpha-mannosidase isoform X2 n=1 Tax=Microplitis demolitor TaxID=69319 RepID=UPI0004CD0835|nr:lysosomal alpha-mannosidase isoform X2 [Microplitis demolitor]
MFKRVLSILLLFLCSFLCFAGIVRDFSEEKTSKKTCGYESCPKIDPKKLNVHLVPHTHDDVGWLKTVDQYYYGSRTLTQKAGVQYIIDTVIEALRHDPARKFIYVETAFLWKWWQRQDDKIKEEVKSFINEGRLEIIGGAWSMNDEATTHYHSIIDQSTWGFRRLNDTFGECARPKIGWQIDPFGHSREQASLFAQFGFDGMFFGRLDYQDKAKRLKDKTAEFLWKASSSLGEKANLFSIALFNNYSPPPGFCFDILCSDDPLIDDPESPDNNIEVKVALFLAYCQIQAKSYNTNNIILTMGEDFNYQNANMWFLNLDKLIRYTNQMYGSTVNVFYSTPSCYIKSLNDAQMSWTTKSDDFFPYSSDPHAFWTGYFTSRPTLKFFERMGNNFLQVTKQLSVLSKLMDSKGLIHFKEAMGVMQHHDAVTGTEKQHVAEDYARLLYASFMHGTNIVSDALSKMLKKDPQAPEVEFKSCLLLNISSCVFSETSGNFVLTLYNPTSQPMSTYVRIPVNGNAYNVKDYTGKEIVTQLLPIPQFVRQTPGRISNSTKELVFRAIDTPALGHQSFYITKLSSNTVEEISQAAISSIGNDLYDVSVNELGNVVIKWKNMNLQVTQSFHYYEGMKGNNTAFAYRASGAYIFRPNQSSIHDFSYSGNHKFYTGPVVNELHLTINNYVSQIVRVYNSEKKIDFEWVVGPIPIDDSVGREVITKYTSNLNSEKTFYTDSNGREMLKRIRNYRPSWNVSLEEPIAGNYYPVTAKIYLEDEKQKIRMSILNDRAQGGTSMIDGELEVMLHRRLLNDDAFGVGEALNETAFGYGLVAKGTHSLLASSLEDLSTVALAEKSEAIALALRPWYLFSPLANLSFNQWNSYYSMQGSSLRNKIPKNLQILTLEPWKDNTILLRLEHLFEKNEAGALSQSVTMNLADLFANLEIVSVKETSLGGNQWIEDMNRLQWQTESNEVDDQPYDFTRVVKLEDGAIEVTLNAMEIRTFILYIKNRSDNQT